MIDQPIGSTAAATLGLPPAATQTQAQYAPGPGAIAAAPSRMWEVLCHVSAIAGFIIPLGHIIGPLIIWLMKRAESPSVDAHGKESLNFQISVTIYGAVFVFLCFVLIGIPLLVLLAILAPILVIVAAVKASNGEFFRYPLTIRLID